MFEGCTGPWRSMSVYFFMKPSSFLQHISVPVCKAQLIGVWYENRRDAPNPIIFLIIRQYYWRTEAPCANSNGGLNTKKSAKYYWCTMLGQDCLLAEGDIGAPIYWRTDPPYANSTVLAHRTPCSITNNR
jgi:hypothetical protein